MNQVQDSSDCCINSKFSSAKKGYFQDDYLSLFINKLHSRSPIINRGYYIRFKAMEEVFQSWWSSVNSSIKQKFQIISLGAGYDSSYIRLKNNNQLPPGCHYVEVDFPEVMKRKYDLIKDHFKCDNRNFSCQDPEIVLYPGEYSLLGIDLTDIPNFQKCLNHVGIDYNVPTLFLSECSITYIDPKCTENFIVWVQNKFPSSTFVAYEQVYPDDAFGLVMRNHFTQVGCPLKSITKYSDEKSQCERFKKLGWPECSVITMYELFDSLSVEEKRRIQKLEMFDEYEMWHEKCHHYVLVWATQGILSKNFPFFLSCKSTGDHPEQNTVTKTLTEWKSVISGEVAQRFGHQVVPVFPSVVIMSGGFGVTLKKHQRLGDIVLYHIESMKYINVFPRDKMPVMGKRMFHSMTKLSDNTLVILGGRSSPKQVFESVLILQDCIPSSAFKDFISSTTNDHDEYIFQKCLSLETSSCKMPVPTWRHSACVVEIEGTECIVVFGGCSQDQIPTNGCFVLDTKSWQWSEISLQEHSPCARHSHSAACYNKSHVIVTGGLTGDENILQSIHMLDCKNFKWSILNISGLLPRYSHTSHIWEDNLFLVGGITSIARYNLGVGVVNLKTLQAFEILPPAQDPEYPILLSNHSSFIEKDEIIVIGGGGNCFSFGTHFNMKIICIDLKLCLQAVQNTV